LPVILAASDRITRAGSFGEWYTTSEVGEVWGENEGRYDMASLKLGSSGPQVTLLRQLLQQRGFDPGGVDGQFDASTDAAVRAFQGSVGLAVDGQAGPNTFAALEAPNITSNVTTDLVAPLFPAAPRVNVQFQLPLVLKALLDATLADKSMVLMALGTIRAETGSFEPIDQGISRFNTSAGGNPFDLYDNRADLGNQGSPDGASFKGRGFVQLTGRANYTNFSNVLGLGTQLVDNPDLANDPVIAARLLAAFLKDKEDRIRAALAANDMVTARRLVNGGSHGLADFTDAYQNGQGLIPDPVQVQVT
jgi:putative chitinase